MAQAGKISNYANLQSTSATNQARFRALEELGRARLSESFLMREFLHSEISQIEQIPNIPHFPELAIHNGAQLCEQVLEPIQNHFGRLSIRSGYRSPEVNAIGAMNRNQYKCASNERNFAGHIWDYPDKNGLYGATACVVICPYIEQYNQSGDWQTIARWVSANIPNYSALRFFPKMCAFNISWHEQPKKKIYSYIRTSKQFENNHATPEHSAVLNSD